ncbi:MAG: hypothetical protein ACXVLQ_02390 [Bacteriovorax sp.]
MKFVFLFFVLTISRAHAFPEMVRHHYVNCLACHESPSGGGILTPYGRSLSYEVLSTWGSVKEARPFYGAFDHKFLKDWFNVGGDLRGLQLHTENSQMKKGMFIRMQTGIESSIKIMKLKLISFFGKQEAGNMVRGEFTRFYALYQPFDEFTVRAGRFTPNFGLNIAEHTLATRKGLGFDEGSERDQIESMWSGEKWNSSLSYTKQVKTPASSKLEKAMTAQLNYNFLDSYRIGGDLWLGNLEGNSRQILGTHAILGFTEKFYYLTEFDWQKGFNKKKGVFHFSKLGYEFIKGIHAIVLEDYKKSDLNDSMTLSNSHGVGLEWYPRPHFEFEGIWSKKRVAIQSSEYSDYAYLMMHYYF